MTNKEFKRRLNSAFLEYRNQNLNELVTPSKFFNQIGSTELEDIAYNKQVEIKLDVLSKIFNEYYKDLDIIKSPKETEYRFKVEFVTSYNPIFEPNSRMGQRKKGNFSWVVDLDEYILIPGNIFKKVRSIYEYARTLGFQGYDLKKNIGDLRYLTVKGINEEIMLIITVNIIDPKCDQLMEYALSKGFKSVYLFLNSSLTDTSEGEIIKYKGEELLTIDLTTSKGEYSFKIGPNTFFQNNVYCFELIVNYIRSFLEKIYTADYFLYDLYCGVGILGILFSDLFKEVKGIEIVKESIELANKNKELNDIKNISFECKDIKLINESKDSKTITLVDPPRNGLENAGVENVLRINSDYIIYISCNPVTLKNDLENLKSKYKVIDLKFFDMFPQTYHVESLCIMQKI